MIENNSGSEVYYFWQISQSPGFSVYSRSTFPRCVNNGVDEEWSKITVGLKCTILAGFTESWV
jgi:hypothetical protein